MASRLLLAAALVVGITCGVRVDIMRARREYPSNEYKGLDKTDVLANASSKANNVSTDLRSLAGIGPVPNATEHMKKWPTCQKLAVVKGGEEASAKIAKDSCREVPRNDVAALDNCFRGACFVALNGDKPARDGQTANSTEEVPENTPASRMGGEGQKNTNTGERITTFNGVKLQPGERVKDGEVVPMGKLSTKEYAILASLMPGHRVSHFCQLDGHTPSRDECADAQCMKDMFQAWSEYTHNNGNIVHEQRLVNFNIFGPEKVYPLLLKGCKFCCTMSYLKSWNVSKEVCDGATTFF